MIKAFAIWDKALLPIRKLYDWMGQQVYNPHGIWMLGLFFFIEAVFFFPADPLLILFCVEQRKRALFYATVATIASVLGGIAGYYIGMYVWQAIGQKLVTLVSSPETFHNLCLNYQKHETWAVLVAGFTPIPYKLVTLTAGFCRLALLPFIACSFIARGARFYLVALLIYYFGASIKDGIDRYFNYLVLLFGILVLIGLLVIR